VAAELAVMKMNGMLVPATEADREQLSSVKQGAGFRVTLTKMSQRSLKHHQLYWAGLIGLVSEYWEPNVHAVSVADERYRRQLLKWMANLGYKTDGMDKVLSVFNEYRIQMAREQMPEYEKAAETLQQIHLWLKEEAGYVDVYMSPTGPKRVIRSINFNSMGQEDFNKFYKAAFNVAWKYVFQRANFDNQEQVENLALELASMSR